MKWQTYEHKLATRSYLSGIIPGYHYSPHPSTPNRTLNLRKLDSSKLSRNNTTDRATRFPSIRKFNTTNHGCE